MFLLFSSLVRYNKLYGFREPAFTMNIYFTVPSNSNDG